MVIVNVVEGQDGTADHHRVPMIMLLLLSWLVVESGCGSSVGGDDDGTSFHPRPVDEIVAVAWLFHVS